MKKARIGIGALVIAGLMLWAIARAKPVKAEEKMPLIEEEKKFPIFEPVEEITEIPLEVLTPIVAQGTIPVGGTPWSAGYGWYPDRQGWMRSWDETTFIPREDVPGWDKFIE